MRIESFWARGFRSLRDLRLDGLGPFNVLYGPNGSGKSNILDAMRVLFDMCRVAAGHLLVAGPDHSCAQDTQAIIGHEILKERDFYARGGRKVVLGVKLTGTPRLINAPFPSDKSENEIEIEFTADWVLRDQPKLALSRLHSGNNDLRSNLTSDEQRHLVALVTEQLPARAYSLVSADRFPRGEDGTRLDASEAMPSLFRRGQLKSALLAAQIGPDALTRRRLEALRKLLSGPPLHRPPFDPVQNRGVVELRERLPEPNPEGLEISLDLAGLGIHQIYTILAQAMLSGARAVAIEEPEAHLHAPTTGRALRQLLVRLVEEKHVDQLFIATHSNLFDLDPGGYIDVSLKDGATVVEQRAELARIDRDHLYEPGPAKHALQRMLSYTPGDEVVFRRPDGAGVTAREMLALLQADDDLAVRFLADVHGAALRVEKINAARAKAG